jgi:hypothetical protein
MSDAVLMAQDTAEAAANPAAALAAATPPEQDWNLAITIRARAITIRDVTIIIRDLTIMIRDRAIKI